VAVLTDDMKRVVEAQSLGFVATVNPDGSPNLSPKGTTAVWDDDHLVFVDLVSPQTTANLRANPAVEVNVVDVITRTGYRFRGRAEVHVDGPEFEAGLAFYNQRSQMDPARVHAIVIIAVESAEPLVSPSYDLGLTKAEVVDRSWRRMERIHSVRVTPI
jgi:uncharacterized protein